MKTGKEIFINVSAGSTRIAITDSGVLSELFIEQPDHQRMVGNIYKGKVQNVIPGMQAAFVDIGYSINAFLPFSEIGNMENNLAFSIDDDDEESVQTNKKNSAKKENPAVDLKVNDEILIQVIKEPFSGKGPRITTDVSIPGNMMVLVPNANYIGISRKISDKYEKRRLRRIVKNFKPENFGIIVRTIAQGKDQKLLEGDFKRLWDIWEQTNETVVQKNAPVLAYQDFATSDRVIRDLFTSETNRLVIDNKPLFRRVSSYVKETNPTQINKIEYKHKRGSIFDQYKIEDQIDKSLRRKVWLKSGAYLIIEHTEAMVVVDVNSGRFIGKKNHEENSLKINLEAARETARQLRLRDIGGLIVIDFIDLQEPANRKKVYEELKNTLKQDRAKVSLSEFSSFGLLEMTRQRIRLSLLHTVSEECPTCNGLGRISSKDTIITKIENWLKRFRAKAKDRRLVIYLHQNMVDYINETKSKVISGFMWDNWMLIDIQADPQLSLDEFKVYSKKRKKDVTSEV
jgi:ribonuclease G